MAFNAPFPQYPSKGELVTYQGSAYRWDGEYWWPYGTSSGYVLTGNSLGNGISIFRDATGNTINFKSFSGNGINITDNGSVIVFSGTGGSGPIPSSSIFIEFIGNGINIDPPDKLDTSFTFTMTVTGGTITGATNFTNGLSANTISGTTYRNLPVSGITGGSNIGVSNSNGNVTISFTGTTGSNFTGGTVTGATNFTGGLSANTFSATTLFGNGSGLTGTLKYYISGSTPSGVINNGDKWFNTETGVELTYITDADGSQWVQTNGGAGVSNAATGGTYSNGTITLLGTGTLSSITGLTTPFTGGTVTGLTINGNLIVTGNTSLRGLTASTLSVTGTTFLGNGTFTKSGFATGDILLDNSSTDTPGVLFYYANNSNYGIDSWSGSFDVLSGQLVRITNNLNETGGAVKMAIDTTGNVVVTGFIKANAWRAGQVVNDIMLSNTEVTVSTTTIATSTSDTDFVTYSYTPLSSTSYLVIHYHLADYSFASGTGNDSYFSRIKVDGNEITFSKQSTVNGNRSGVLFPLTGRYTNSNTTAKSIVVACRRDSADDSITIANTATSMWLRITEIAR